MVSHLTFKYLLPYYKNILLTVDFPEIAYPGFKTQFNVSLCIHQVSSSIYIY